jgi:hypothetical protein
MANTKKEKIKKQEKYLKFHAWKLGIAGGAIIAICIFITTIAAITTKNYATLSTSLISDIYGIFGYKVSFLGAILGAIYGFIDGFIITWIYALIYNKLISYSKSSNHSFFFY